MPQHALLLTLTLAFIASSSVIATESAHAENESYPRFSAGLVGGVSIPVLFDTGDAGGYINGSLGVRFNEYVQWDIFEAGGIMTWQNEVVCIPDCVVVDYRADALFIGTAARIGYFEKSSPVNPYLIAGLGAGRINYDFPGLSTWDWGFAGSVGVGAEIPIGEHFTAGGMYRFYAQRDDLFLETAKVHTIGLEVGWR